MNRFEILAKAIETYGVNAQIDMAIEEMAELTKALCKFKRSADAARARDIKEEMADVQIMLDQLMIMFSADADVAKFDKHKIARLAERLGMRPRSRGWRCRKMDDKQVCGTCYWHKRDGGDWVCTNGNSDNCADWTEYSDSCDEWEGRG